jgi:hypothetical protein
MTQITTIWTFVLPTNHFFFAFSFFPLPPSSHPFILFFLCRPTGLLVNGAPTSAAMATSGEISVTKWLNHSRIAPLELVHGEIIIDKVLQSHISEWLGYDDK